MGGVYVVVVDGETKLDEHQLDLVCYFYDLKYHI